ncbi:MAG: ribonuclease D [Ardenticatenaceae bacterium]|nr:ribonuclease D [Ardenticatenaceae bacterium]
MNPNIEMCEEDISKNFLDAVLLDKKVAIDTETSGLRWQMDSLEVIQLYAPSRGVSIVRRTSKKPERIIQVIERSDVRKVLHYAFFDLCFIQSTWRCNPKNIACTKIASKILDPKGTHSLSGLLKSYFDIDVDKALQTSDWSHKELSLDQIEYAANDVRYLLALIERLESDLKDMGRLQLAKTTYKYVKTKTELELLGVKNALSF